jgi:UDP-N-acetylmuramoyl-L-alanyl-D-glutamate--2,6-diaminopimelate ligase
MAKTLASLFSEFPFKILKGTPGSTTISSVVADSRIVQPGDLFVATKGEHSDAHRFIAQAVQSGAVAVVGMEVGISTDVPYFQVENSRQALAYLSAAFYDFPARKMAVIGVTGTDGKTTTSNLIYEILVAAGFKAGMISTVNAVIGIEVIDTGFHVTTPDSPDVQRYLAKMVDAGVTHVVLETTSHGWAQYRVDACEIDIGVVTNITHEHLDEHGSYENYRGAKARLFESLALTSSKSNGNPRLGVLNADDGSFEYLKSIIPTHFKSYGFSPDADVYAEEVKLSQDGTAFTGRGPDWHVQVASKLVGDYNISNCLAALTAVVYGLGVDPEMAARGIANLDGIPGRMERIDLGQNFTAIVDFAHSPNALMVTIDTARSFTSGRVIVAFGSAGLRDREKRRMMAEISAENADYTVLTAEDPRTEPVDQILAEMAAGATEKGGLEGSTFWRVPDRGDAIRFSLSLARSGDVVLVCGKGHEQSMCYGETEYPWDDRVAVKAALAELLSISGPKMPILPNQKRPLT